MKIKNIIFNKFRYFKNLNKNVSIFMLLNEFKYRKSFYIKKYVPKKMIVKISSSRIFWVEDFITSVFKL